MSKRKRGSVCNDTHNKNGSGSFTWTKHVQGGPLRANFAMVALKNMLYVFGGYTQEPSRNISKNVDVFCYNIESNVWYEVVTNVGEEGTPDDIPCGRYGHTVVAHEDKIYLWGGNSEHSIDNSLYCFDTRNYCWKKVDVRGTAPVLRDGHTACVIGDKMYVFGGLNHLLTKLTNSVIQLDLKNFQWTYLEPSGLWPIPRDFHSVVVIGQKMYVFGGRKINVISSGQEMHSNELFCLDTADMCWHRPVPAIGSPLPRRSHGMFCYKNDIYVFGGYNSQVGRHLNDLYRFSFTDNTWTAIYTTGTLPCCRKRFGLSIVGSEVFIVGGIAGHCWKEKRYSIESSEYKSIEKRELNDVHVLQLDPTLQDLCLRMVANLGLEKDLTWPLRRDMDYYKGLTKLKPLGGV